MPIGYAQHESFHWPAVNPCHNTIEKYDGGAAMVLAPASK